MGMTRDEIKKSIKRNFPTTPDRVIDEEIDKVGKKNDYDKNDFDKVVEEIKNRQSESIKEKTGKQDQ